MEVCRYTFNKKRLHEQRAYTYFLKRRVNYNVVFILPLPPFVALHPALLLCTSSGHSYYEPPRIVFSFTNVLCVCVCGVVSLPPKHWNVVVYICIANCALYENTHRAPCCGHATPLYILYNADIIVFGELRVKLFFSLPFFFLLSFSLVTFRCIAFVFLYNDLTVNNVRREVSLVFWPAHGDFGGWNVKRLTVA